MPPYDQIRRSIQSNAKEQRENADPIKGDALTGCCEKEAYILTLGGRIRCPRCQAKSKRS